MIFIGFDIKDLSVRLRCASAAEAFRTPLPRTNMRMIWVTECVLSDDVHFSRIFSHCRGHPKLNHPSNRLITAIKCIDNIRCWWPHATGPPNMWHKGCRGSRWMFTWNQIHHNSIDSRQKKICRLIITSIINAIRRLPLPPVPNNSGKLWPLNSPFRKCLECRVKPLGFVFEWWN